MKACRLWLCLPLIVAGCGRDGQAEADAAAPRQVAAPASGSRSEAEICAAEIADEEAWRAAKSLWPACPRSFASADGRWELLTTASEPMKLRLRPRGRPLGQGIEVGTFDFPASVAWSPASDSFFVNDSKGSGQSSYVRYYRIDRGRPVESPVLKDSMGRLFKRVFGCRAPDEYVYTRGEGWSRDGRLMHVEVWISHHAPGCRLDPFLAAKLNLIVDPVTGEVFEDVERLRQVYFGEAPSTAG